MAKGADLTPLTSAFVTCTITFDLTCRFWMIDMRWKALGRAVNMGMVSAQGGAAFQAILRRSLRGRSAPSGLLNRAISLNRRHWLWALDTTS